MKKLLLLICPVILTTILTTGMLFAQKTEKRIVSDFSGIEAGSVFDITVTKGDATSVNITADEKILPFVKTEVNNGVLKLFVTDNHKGDINTLKADIIIKELNSINLSGASKFAFGGDEVFTAKNLSVRLSGASSIKLLFYGDKLDFAGTGSSKSEINAKVREISSGVSGASKLVLLIPENEVAKVVASGASKQIITGTAKTAEFVISGASSVIAEELEVETAKVIVSGASSLNNLNVKDELEVTASGASKVSYKGNPRTQINSSGASSIKSKK